VKGGEARIVRRTMIAWFHAFAWMWSYSVESARASSQAWWDASVSSYIKAPRGQEKEEHSPSRQASGAVLLREETEGGSR
jgi:hypothetical protein